MGSGLFHSIASAFRLKRANKTLYEKLGGETGIDAAVSILYRKVLSDDQISGFFEGLCMQYQTYKLKVFLTMVFDGPIKYTGKSLREAHAKLVDDGLNDTHFDLLLNHLSETLTELDVPAPELTQVIDIAESVRNDVLGR